MTVWNCQHLRLLPFSQRQSQVDKAPQTEKEGMCGASALVSVTKCGTSGCGKGFRLLFIDMPRLLLRCRFDGRTMTLFLLFGWQVSQIKDRGAKEKNEKKKKLTTTKVGLHCEEAATGRAELQTTIVAFQQELTDRLVDWLKNFY